jgi:hypothetical protein
MKQPDVSFCFMAGATPKYRPGWVALTPQVLLPPCLKLKFELRNGFNYHMQSIHSYELFDLSIYFGKAKILYL